MVKRYCKDCQKRIVSTNYFMVKNDLWEKFGVGKGLLCIDCFEARLGRKLIASDLLENCFVNEEVNPYTKVIIQTFKRRMNND